MRRSANQSYLSLAAGEFTHLIGQRLTLIADGGNLDHVTMTFRLQLCDTWLQSRDVIVTWLAQLILQPVIASITRIRHIWGGSLQSKSVLFIFWITFYCKWKTDFPKNLPSSQNCFRWYPASAQTCLARTVTYGMPLSFMLPSSMKLDCFVS